MNKTFYTIEESQNTGHRDQYFEEVHIARGWPDRPYWELSEAVKAVKDFKGRSKRRLYRIVRHDITYFNEEGNPCH